MVRSKSVGRKFSGRGERKKDRKIALFDSSGGNGKKDRKIAKKAEK